MYGEQDYPLVSGLIEPNIAAEAEAAMWRLLNAGPANLCVYAGSKNMSDRARLALNMKW